LDFLAWIQISKRVQEIASVLGLPGMDPNQQKGTGDMVHLSFYITLLVHGVSHNLSQ